MDRLLFAAVADDDTGASDLAGMLAERGVSTLLVIDLPSIEQFAEWGRGYQAIIMAEGTRNIAPAAAYDRTRAAVRLLATRQPRLLQIKYCSTFDSTPEGNIGPSIDAALDEMGEEFTVAVPALPVNHRTTYQGYHFVGGQLLSDSPMRHHPLTPMTDPNLVEVLSRQTWRRVGLAAYSYLERGPAAFAKRLEELRDEGVSIALVDCLNDNHVGVICRVAAGLRLVSGSSVFGIGLPEVWRERGLMAEDGGAFASAAGASARAGCLIVAGSCSEATRRQNNRFVKRGGMVNHVHPRELLSGEFDRTALVERLRRALALGHHCLLTTSAGPDEVREAQEWGSGEGMSAGELGEAISGALARLTREVLEAQLPAGLIVAGGETSGALCRRLKLGALRVGSNIEPGVPVCFSLGEFGGEDFYDKAIRAVG
jgi:3-dehydrotetronate 4-kinase